MSDPEQLLIFKKAYQLVKWLMNHTGKFPKSHRFSLAVKIENSVIELLELFITANMSQSKIKFLIQADQKLTVLKILLRLSYEMQFVSINSYEYGARELVEMGKMLGGWIKQSKNV
jgi:hypothetical protein